MTATPAPSNHPVFLLAEHLDMILAAVEDLSACRPIVLPPEPQRVGSLPRVSLKQFAFELQSYELAAIGHVGRARELARQMVRLDKRFAMLGGLFVGGTAALDEAVQRMADTTGNAFLSGGDPIGYLRSRGVIGDDAGGIELGSEPEVGDDFRIAGEIEIGPLSELVGTFLNTIELHFDLFPELSDPNDVMAPQSDLVS